MYFISGLFQLFLPSFQNVNAPKYIYFASQNYNFLLNYLPSILIAFIDTCNVLHAYNQVSKIERLQTEKIRELYNYSQKVIPK